MDASYVKEMERLANEGKVIETGGLVFSPLNMCPVLYEPRPEPVKVRTLTALTRYIEDNVDTIDSSKLIVHVESPGSVQLMSCLTGTNRKRDVFLVAESDGARFRFGTWMSPEEFIIGVNSLFVPTDTRDVLLRFVSSLKVENESNINDDGISQSASVRIGVKGSLSEQKPAPSRIALKPFRRHGLSFPHRSGQRRVAARGDAERCRVDRAHADGAWSEHFGVRRSVGHFLGKTLSRCFGPDT